MVKVKRVYNSFLRPNFRKYSLCLHDKFVFRSGRGLKALYFCAECGMPMINDIVDLQAYLLEPRESRKTGAETNGWVIQKKRFTIDGFINFLLQRDILEILSFGYPSREGDFFDWVEWFETIGWGDVKDTSIKTRINVLQRFVKFLEWRKRANEFLSEMREIARELTERCGYDLSNFPEVSNILVFFAKTLKKLKRKEIAAILGFYLTKRGWKARNIMKALGIGNYMTVQLWGKRGERILKIGSQFPNLFKI